MDLIHVKAPGPPKSPGTSPSSLDTSLKVPYPVALALPAFTALQGSNKIVLMSEEIAHVSKAPTIIENDLKGNDVRSTAATFIQNREVGSPHRVAPVMYGPENSMVRVPLAVDTLNQAPGASSVPPLHAGPVQTEGAPSDAAGIHDHSGNGNFQSVAAINHSRATRKRKLSERGKESLESTIDLHDDYMKGAVQLAAMSPQSSQEVQATNTSYQSNLMQVSERTADPPAKKRGRPKKMQVSELDSNSQGRPRNHPQPKIQAIMPISPSKMSSPSMNTGNATISSPLLATPSTNNYSTLASQGDFDIQTYPDQFGRNHPIIPRPPVTNPEAALSAPEKRPRGRPKKAAFRKSIPATPVAIKPKPVVNRESNRVDSEWHHFLPQG